MLRPDCASLCAPSALQDTPTDTAADVRCALALLDWTAVVRSSAAARTNRLNAGSRPTPGIGPTRLTAVKESLADATPETQGPDFGDKSCRQAHDNGMSVKCKSHDLIQRATSDQLRFTVRVRPIPDDRPKSPFSGKRPLTRRPARGESHDAQGVAATPDHPSPLIFRSVRRNIVHRVSGVRLARYHQEST